MFNKLRRHQALIISLGVHALLIFIFLHYSFISQQQKIVNLSVTQETNHNEIIQKEAIKSYLYSPAKLLNTQPKTEDTSPGQEVLQVEVNTIQLEKQPVNPIATANETPPKLPADIRDTTLNYPDNKAEITPPKLSYQHLNSLREQINQRMIEDEIAISQQFKSPSVMHGEQIPVPHAKKQISAQEKKELSTTNYAEGLSITKGDNGFCTVERDLSSIGIEGIKSIQGFACGESAMNKSFREHMDKVKKKLGK